MGDLVRLLRRIAITVAGTVMLVVGVVLLVAPGPGILVILLALVVFAIEYEWARRRLGVLRARARSAADKTAASRIRTASAVLFAVGAIGLGAVLVTTDLLPLSGVGAGASVALAGLTALVTLAYSWRELRRCRQDRRSLLAEPGEQQHGPESCQAKGENRSYDWRNPVLKTACALTQQDYWRIDACDSGHHGNRQCESRSASTGACGRREQRRRCSRQEDPRTWVEEDGEHTPCKRAPVVPRWHFVDGTFPKHGSDRIYGQEYQERTSHEPNQPQGGCAGRDQRQPGGQKQKEDTKGAIGPSLGRKAAAQPTACCLGHEHKLHWPW